MSTSRTTETGAPSTPYRPATSALAPTTTVTGDLLDPVLALLQQHQVSQISPRAISAAESRLHDALNEARHGRRADPALLLQQLATDLGITLSLS